MAPMDALIRKSTVLAVLLIAWNGVAPLCAAPTDVRSNAVYKRLIAQTAGVKTLQSEISVHTQMKSFPPISLTFHGHSYYSAPDKQATKFDNVPGPLRRMMADSPSIAPARAWPSVYDIEIIPQGSQTIFRLTPQDPSSPLDHVDATIDNATGLVLTFAFTNKNGSTTTTENTYTAIGRHEFVSSQTGESTGHGYHAEITTTFSDYQVNQPLPDDAFDQ